MRARMLAAFFLIILINSILLILSLVLGYDSSRKYWNYLLEQESRKVVMEFLTGVIEKGGVLDASSSSDILEHARHNLMGSAQVYLFSPEGEHLESWINPILENYTPHHPDLEKAESLRIQNQLRGYVQIIPLSFRHVKHNNIFISRIINLFSLGLIISTGLSLLLGFRISSSFTKEARNTARSLINLAGGSRKEEFGSTPTMELSSINEAAGSLQSMLLAEEARRSRWSLSIAHDLRTPLTAMKTQFTACRDGALNMTPERWDRILSELETMESLTRDFLILGELDAAGSKLTVSRVRTESLKRGISDSLEHLALAGGISIEWNEQLSSLYCDFNLTCRALEGLVKNAIQHMPAPGKVEIIVSGSSESPVIQVINPGHIPEEHLPHLFDPLYKTDKSRKKVGSGLGLTISRRIADFHKGALTVSNISENRVCFSFSLNHG